MVFPRFVGQAVKGDPITVYGGGQQTRCFCYVGDVVGGLLALMDHPEASGRAYKSVGPPGAADRIWMPTQSSCLAAGVRQLCTGEGRPSPRSLPQPPGSSAAPAPAPCSARSTAR